jgi:O-acetyl-ADP-ribose deacetylase (regulator of RNase III)
MNVVVAVGDVLDTPADVLISTANPWLNLSGGVNGAIGQRCPQIQAELHAYLDARGQSSVPATSVIRTSAGSLPFLHIIHAVAIDPFYDSSIQLVARTLIAAFDLAETLAARTISLPTLATGYGPMSIESFGLSFVEAAVDRFDFDNVTIVVRNAENAETINSVIAANE